MNKNLDYYMGLSYRVEVIEDKAEGSFTLRCPELHGCLTVADTIDEGFRQIEDAKREWFAACIEADIDIPEPAAVENFSGQFKLRIPKSLHMSLAQRAGEEGVSMNQYCVYLLSKGC